MLTLVLAELNRNRPPSRLEINVGHSHLSNLADSLSGEKLQLQNRCLSRWLSLNRFPNGRELVGIERPRSSRLFAARFFHSIARIRFDPFVFDTVSEDSTDDAHRPICHDR